MENGMPNNKKRPVIDLETLEVWESLSQCARSLNVSTTDIFQAIEIGFKAKGRRLEYFDWWLGWDNRDKEKYTRKNNIYFI